jgi:hypothetical protein
MTKKQLHKSLAETLVTLAKTMTSKRTVETELEQVKRQLRMAQYREARYRKMFERATGETFVFGFDPTDASMVEGDERTYGWFIPTPTPSYRQVRGGVIGAGR